MAVFFFSSSFWNGNPGGRNDLRVNGTRGVEGCRFQRPFRLAGPGGRWTEGRRPAWQPSPTWGPCDTPWLSVERRLSASASPLALHRLQLPPVVQYSTVTTTPRSTPTCFCSSLIDCYCFQILDGPKKLLQKVNNGFSFFFNLGSRLVTHMIGYG